ncbi:MAG TPA: hypothetical protein VJV74_11505 [Terriglobia bacterium]|nr:hypothetical protein [Terriglobia bacterium]
MKPEEKTRIRWRRISDNVDWSCWEVNGERIIVDPSHLKGKPDDERVLRVATRLQRKGRGTK